MKLATRRGLVPLLLLALVGAAELIGWRFNSDLQLARHHAAQGALSVPTRCGPIEYRESGTGVPLLVIHGSGVGQDRGIALAGELPAQGVRVIAMSRFGYLRTPMAPDPSAAAQADVHLCLLDALGVHRAAVMGYSAGGPSALQIAGARFIGFDRGGHTWIGHEDQILDEIVKMLVSAPKPLKGRS